DLVAEGDVRLRQLVRREPPVVVLLERLQADRPEQLLRRGEAGKQPLEVLGPGDPAADLVGEHRLGRARRADHEHMLLRDKGDERSVDELGPLEEDLLHLVPDGAQDVTRSGHLRRIADSARARQARITHGLATQYVAVEEAAALNYDPTFI